MSRDARWYLPDGTPATGRPIPPEAVPSVTTILGDLLPRPGLQAWRERELLRCAAELGVPRGGTDEWVSRVRQELDSRVRATAAAGTAWHERLAAGDVPAAIRADLERLGMDLDGAQAEVPLVSRWLRVGGTLDRWHPAQGWVLDWKTTTGPLDRVWPDWLLQLGLYSVLAEHEARRSWPIADRLALRMVDRGVVVAIHRDTGEHRVHVIDSEELARASDAGIALVSAWWALRELGVV